VSFSLASVHQVLPAPLAKRSEAAKDNLLRSLE
jgi:hypothetical protein